MLVNQIREDMIAHPLNYVDRFAMTDSYETLCTNAKHHYIDCSYDGIKCFLYGKTGYSDAFNNGAWLFTHPDLVAKFNGEPLPEQESNPEFYKTDFWTKLAFWIEANMKGTSVERRQRLYNSYISDRPIQHQLTEYGLIAPDGTWYACEFGEHAALAGRIIMRIEKRLVFLTMKFSIWRMTGAARVSISYINAVGLPFVILRWAIHSSIWMRPKPQQKLK